MPQQGRAPMIVVVKYYNNRRHLYGIPRLITCHLSQTRRSSADARACYETRPWTSDRVPRSLVFESRRDHDCP
ncbi:MAG TPA: hypothetical protein VEP90_27530, partial [Methylomirabilota bacterium]|nr:hypothetical protein [Methylomirabilota bacterium]